MGIEREPGLSDLYAIVLLEIKVIHLDIIRNMVNVFYSAICQKSLFLLGKTLHGFDIDVKKVIIINALPG